MVPSVLSNFITDSDYAVSSHRSHAHYLAKGGSLNNFFDELHGLQSGCSAGRGGSMHLTDASVNFVASTAIVGNTVPIGVGIGNAIKLRKEPHISVIYLGDGATEEGVFWESVQYSITTELPCLFVIENNNYSVYTPLYDRQRNTSIFDKLSGFSRHVYSSTNHDYDLFSSHCSEAVSAARHGNPSFLLVDTFRYLEHCGPSCDDQLEYRSPEYISHWRSLDILDLFTTFLLKHYDPTYLDSFTSHTQSSCQAAYKHSLAKRLSLVRQF